MEILKSPWLWAAIAFLNVLTFAVYAVDKHIAKSRKGGRRVPERTLILLAFCGGSFGALLGMVLCRHKTKHIKFLVLVPLAALLWIAAFVLLALLLGGWI